MDGARHPSRVKAGKMSIFILPTGMEILLPQEEGSSTGRFHSGRLQLEADPNKDLGSAVFFRNCRY